MAFDPIATAGRPLSGIRVLDLTRGMPGAVASMVWADYGAEVIRVEQSGGGILRRTGGHSIWNRGKRSLVADLDDATQRALVQQLAAGADVVLEDHRPGKVATWGLDHDTVRGANHDVIHCSISAYGQQGSRRDRVATDAAVMAHLGVMNEWAGHREGPIFLAHPAVDYSTALLASTGVLSLLLARVKTGHGNRLDVSLMDGSLALYTMNWSSPNFARSINSKKSDGTLNYGNKRLLLRLFECKGGDLIQVHTGAAGAFDRCMDVLGLGAEVTKQQGAVQMSSFLTERDMEIIEAKVPGIFLTRTRDEWLELFWSNQIAALPVHQPGEVLDDAQVRHAGIVASVQDPALGAIEMVGPTVLLSASPGGIASPAPVLDEDGADIRADGWRSPGLGEVNGKAPLDAPLAGVKILEFASFFAAPYSDRLLSDLGAEVLKIEGLDGDPMRPLADTFEGGNRGKRSIAANMKDPRAVEVVRALVADADVVQHNLRPGAAERMGIDDASMRAIRSDLVYHYAPGYGSTGPKSLLQSFAPLLSGFVGVFANGAGLGNRPHGVFGNEDYYNGLLGSTACLLGLVHRERTGVGQFVESPQLHSSVFTTSEFYKSGGGIRSVIPRMGPELYGWAAGYRIYQTLDGWICVSCTHDDEVVRLVGAVVPEEDRAAFGADALTIAASESGALAQALEYRFVERQRDEWVEVLRAAGVPVEAVTEEPWLSEDMFHDPELASIGAVKPIDHPLAGKADVVGDVIRPAVNGAARRGRAPRHGEHTREVLRSVGRSESEIEALIADGVFTAAD